MVNAPIRLKDRSLSLLLLCILFLSLILRTAALLSLEKSVYFDFLLWDERLYHVWAAKIADGTCGSSSVYENPPLPAYVMALMYKIFSPDVLSVRLLNILLGVLTCYLVYHIGKLLVDRTTGLFACLIACLYKPFLFYSIVPLKTALSLFLFSLSVHLFLEVLNRYSAIKTFLLGAVVGLLLNVRGNYVVLFPPMLFFTLLSLYKTKSRIKSLVLCSLLFAAGFSASISPFVIRNYRVSGKPALTVTQAGFNLYCGNGLENKTPYYRPVPFASPSPFEQGIQFTIEASRRANRKLSPREASAYWTKEVIRTALRQPAAFSRRLFQKLLALFNRFEAGDHYHIGFMSSFVRFFKIPFFGFWLIMPLGMAEIAFTLPRSKKSMALGSLFLFYGLTLVLFFTNTRYRLPLLIILIPLAAAGICRLLTFIRNRQLRRAGVYCAVAVVFFFIEFLPLSGTEDMTAYYNTHAVILSSKSRTTEAVDYWERSSQMEGAFSAFADIDLSRHYLGRGDLRKALYYRNKIPDDSFTAAYKYELTGDIFAALGQGEDAAAAYERSLEINSGQIRTREKLIRLYRETDKQKALEESERLLYIASFYSAF